MTIKSFASSLILALLSVFATVSTAADLKSIRVAHDTWVGYAGYYVALEKGFFKDVGLNIDDKTFNTPADGLPALLTGDVDIHFSTLDTFLTALEQQPKSVKAIALIDSSAGADAVIAKKGVADIAALKGKRIGVSLGQANHMLLLRALESKSLAARDVKLVNLNGDDAGNAFAAGKLDAAVTWEPFITQGLSGGGHVLYSTIEAPDFIVNAIGLKPETMIKKRPELLAFLKAYYRGSEWVLANRTEAAAIVARALDQKPADVLDMMSKDKLYTRSDSLGLMGTAASPGKVVTTTEFIAKFLKDNKIIRKPVDISEFIDASLLQEVK